MKKIISAISITGLMLGISFYVSGSCISPGSFTLNNPSSSNIYGTSINLTWTEATNAALYTIYYRVSGNSTWETESGGTGTSATLSGLSYGTTYQIKIVATNFCSGPPPEYDPITATRDSNTRTITTEPQAPSTYAGSNIGTTSFTASWTSRTGATSYDLDVSTSSSFTSFVSGYNGLNVSTTSQSVTGLSSATRYYYRVRAVNSSGESSNSSSRTVYTIPDTPVMDDASSHTQTTFVVSWDAVARADSYRLDVSTSNLFFTYVTGYQNLTVTGTSQTVSGLTPGTTYYFRVRAYDTAGSTTSGNPSAKSTATIPDDPSANAASGHTQSSFSANWDAETGASSYLLDVSEVDDFSTYLVGYENRMVNGTTHEVTGLAAGTSYYYRLRSENASGVSSNSNEIETITIPDEPVESNATSVTQSSFTANWEATTGAASYRLDVSEESDFSTYLFGYPMFGITDTEQSVNGLIAGTTYYYRVFASNTSGTSGSSSSVETITIPSNPVSQEGTDITSTSFDANWLVVFGSTGYKLDVSATSDFSTFVSGYEDRAVSGTSESVTGLDPASLYYYRVRSENASGVSGDSDSESVLTIPATPVSLAASNIDQVSFTANWNSVAGVTNYVIDVSTADDFSSFVAGYKNLSVNETFKVVDGLSQGTTYYYRVKSENGSGTSESSETQSALTIPGAPEVLSATDILETSFTANWQSTTGASEYRLDVSEFSDFSEMIAGYEDLTVNGTSEDVIGLLGGQTYYYRLRAVNTTGTSGQSSDIETLTLSPVPDVAEATDHSTTSFTAHWQAVDGVEEYLLDVSTQEDFSEMLEEYNNLEVDGSILAHEVSGLTAGTSYYYRISAQNASGNSAHSESITTITIAEQTEITGFSDHTSTKFRVSWEEVSGVETYELFVATDPNFNNPVEGKNPLEIQNILTEAFVEGLTPNTIYYVKLRATNVSGSSDFSAIKTTATANSDGSVVKPSIDDLEFDSDQLKITWSVSGGTGGITSILLSHRKITESEFTEESISVNQSGDYEVEVSDDWMDMTGMQYQLDVTDLAGRSATSGLITFNKSIAEVEVPISETFGTTVNDYQIISIPYELTTTRIEDLFEGVLGSYDKARWRLLKYKNDETGYVDYEDGLAVSNVQRGAGYWFISSQSVDLTFGGGQTPSNTIDEPFELELNQGWNQIGNPYLENILWSDVLSVNGNPETVGSLFVYNSVDATLEEGDQLKVFGGGFVFADQAITLNIPVDINLGSSDGRLANESEDQIINLKHWSLDFELRQGMKVNRNAGIGMHASAKSGKDHLDVLNPPHFSDHVAIYSIHDDFFYEEFATDVVYSANQYDWTYQIRSNSNDPVHLSWNTAQFPEGSLILYDLKDNRLIDMRDQQSYTFGQGNQQFKIYFTIDDIELGTLSQLGHGYPNPVVDQMVIPFGFHIGEESSAATMTVFDQFGKKIDIQTAFSNDQGIRTLHWRNDFDLLPSGLYYYQIHSTTGDLNQQVFGKIIIK